MVFYVKEHHGDAMIPKLRVFLRMVSIKVDHVLRELDNTTSLENAIEIIVEIAVHFDGRDLRRIYVL